MASRKTKYAPGSRAYNTDATPDDRTADREERRAESRSLKAPIARPPEEPVGGFAAIAAELHHRSQGRNDLADLDTFYDQSLIVEVDRIIKIGKEASAYLCHAGEALGGGLVVAKVYRARQYRFKNDAVYMEGRERVLGGRTKRAMAKGSGFGQAVGTNLWVNAEWETMRRLDAAGVSVPKPLASSAGAILMQYFGDEALAAPQLNRVRMSPAEAQRTFDSIMRAVEVMLTNHVVHGDLSPHNILYWQDKPIIIDFPQAVDPRFNSHARDLFLRDVENICRYFALQGIDTDPYTLANDMWVRYETGELR